MAEESRQAEEASGAASCGGLCVVLSPPGSALLGRLLPVLSRRWPSVSVVTDEPAVMEQLALGGVSLVVAVEPRGFRHLRALADAVGQHFGRVLCMKFDVEPGEDEPRITSLGSLWMEPSRPTGLGSRRETREGVSASLGATGPSASSGGGRDDMLPPPQDTGAGRAAVGAELDADEALLQPRRKVDHLAVSAHAGGGGVPGAKAQAGPPKPLVTQEELSMLLGAGPGEGV